MMEFWKTAVALTGVAGVVSFVLWSLYRDWLKLDVWQQMTKRHQFVLFMTFLVLTFIFALSGLVTYAYIVKQNGPLEAVPSIDGQWEHLAFEGDRWVNKGTFAVTTNGGSVGYTMVEYGNKVPSDHRVKRFEHVRYTGNAWAFNVHFADNVIGFFRFDRNSPGTFRGSLTTDTGEPPSEHKLEFIGK